MGNSKQKSVSSKQKKNRWVLVLFTISCLLFTRIVSAHTFLTDGDITVLLHTNPDDDPIIGQPVAVLFEITDSTNKFNSNNCDCAVTISNGSQVLFNGPLLHIVGASVYDLTAPVTFPAKGIYSITVRGKPKTIGAFQNFQVEYNLRVDRGTAVATPSSNPSRIFMMVLVGLILAISLGLGIYFIGNKQKRA